MPQPYQISVDPLRRGETQKYVLTLAPDFLEIEEPELCFPEEVRVVGDAYVVEENLVLRFDAKTKIEMPCLICNQKILLPLAIQGVYHTVPLEECSSSLFDLRPAVREELLVELPKTAECSGRCPERPLVSRFMRAQEKKETSSNYFPFSDLK